MIHPNFIFSK